MSRLNIVGAGLVKDIGSYSFKDIKLGDSFQTKGLFSGVSDDTVLWRLIEANLTKSDLIFEVSYGGIYIGDYSISPAQNNKVTKLL